jgi:VWFA-related protein
MKIGPRIGVPTLSFGTACLLLIAASALSQTNKVKIKINTVVVPVIVTNKEGSHVTGLNEGAFEIKENGQVQKVISFEEINANSSPVPKLLLPLNRFTNSFDVESPKTLEVIALDLINTPFVHQAEAKKALTGFLLHLVHPNTLVSLFVLEPNSVHMIHSFTDDTGILIEALKKVESRASSRDAQNLSLGAGMTDEASIEAAQFEAIVAGAGAIGYSASDSEIATASVRAAAGRARVDASVQNQEARETLEELQQIAAYLANVPGRKSLIWASSGFKSSIQSMAGQMRGADVEATKAAIRQLQQANVSVYPIDVSGLLSSRQGALNAASMNASVLNVGSDPGNVNARSAQIEAYEAGLMDDPIASKHETMSYMASATGGEAYYNQNDLEKLLQRAVEDSSQYYLLTYNTNEDGKEGWRKLEVKVEGSGYKVRSRSGFFFTNEIRAKDEIGQAEELLAVTSLLNFSQLPLTGTWLPIEGSGPKRKVPFTLALPAGAVTIDAEHNNRINLDFIVIATSPDGKEAGRMTQRLERTLPPAAVSQVESGGLTYANSLNLPPGDYTVHLVVRDSQSGKIGSVVAQLKVP